MGPTFVSADNRVAELGESCDAELFDYQKFYLRNYNTLLCEPYGYRLFFSPGIGPTHLQMGTMDQITKSLRIPESSMTAIRLDDGITEFRVEGQPERTRYFFMTVNHDFFTGDSSILENRDRIKWKPGRLFRCVNGSSCTTYFDLFGCDDGQSIGFMFLRGAENIDAFRNFWRVYDYVVDIQKSYLVSSCSGKQ